MTSESVLQRQILAHLQALPRSFFWRANTGGASTGDGFIKFGVSGQSDVLGCAAGHFVAIEIKTEIGKQSSVQRAFQSRVEASGGTYVLARSLDDAINPVRELLR